MVGRDKATSTKTFIRRHRETFERQMSISRNKTLHVFSLIRLKYTYI
jgi:hypothetical protein